MAVTEDQTYRYADASGDRNPIHVKPEFAVKVGLPGIILQGLCTMAFCQKAVLDHCANRDPARLKKLFVRFSKPVLPKDQLTTTGWKLDAKPGLARYGFETTRPDGTVVIKNGLAEVSG
jgi:acyl dehydratase